MAKYAEMKQLTNINKGRLMPPVFEFRMSKTIGEIEMKQLVTSVSSRVVMFFTRILHYGKKEAPTRAVGGSKIKYVFIRVIEPPFGM
jgi:hypothetical protein